MTGGDAAGDGELRSVRVIVRGRVQGVFFRAFTQRKAAALGLVGSVRNLPDASVEVVAEGRVAAVDALCAWLRDEGSPLSRVDATEVSARSPEGRFVDFAIRR